MGTPTYTKDQVLAIADNLVSRAEKLEGIKARDLSVETIGIIAVEAERLALHAGAKDMHFTAVSMLAIASKMNRLLIKCLAS